MTNSENLHEARWEEATRRANTAQSMHDCFTEQDHYDYLVRTGWKPSND